MPDRASQHVRPIVLQGTLLVSGASVMIIEILGTRILGPFYGLGLQVWAALITVALVALAVGYWIGGRVADRWGSPTLFHALVAGAGLATFLVRLLASPTLHAFAGLGLEAGALASAFVIFGPALFLLGMLTPLAVRLHPRHAVETGSTVGRLYAVSTIGSVIGALLAGFVLVPLMPISRIFQVVAASLGIVGLIGLATRRRGIAAVALVLLIVGGVPEREPVGSYPGLHLIRDEQTFYGHVQTIDSDKTGERYLMLDGLIHTHVRNDDPEDPIQCQYVRKASLVPLFMPEAKRFLLIGCGGGSMLRLLAGEGRTFDVVDIDEAVLRAAKEDFGADVEGARFHVGDGRVFLRGRGPWDAILLDVVSTEVMPEHLCSVEFLREVKDRLVPGGVLLMNSIGRPGGRVLGSFAKTIDAVFKHRMGFGAHVRPESMNVVWLAMDREIPVKRLPRLELYTRYEPRDEGIVLTDDYNPVNPWNAGVGLTLRRELHETFGRRIFEAR